ncbi:MAG: TIR domain-containing protein [Anaerolineae bacterium]|nr:TIR domain-containing protein [Anaerolineae bacterium]MEB2286841.1 TIR domain-containing protein [Anaerolineae bacterium]
MPHILICYAPSDHAFARHLAVQLEQRGIVIWPVPDPGRRSEKMPADDASALAAASHVLIVLSTASTAPDASPHWTPALQGEAEIVLVLRDECAIPSELTGYPAVNFEGQFLLAFEELASRLITAGAPTRPLTVEHPPPVAKRDLLPLHMPAERCWREDRLRINYTLPIILTADELQTRLPAFLAQAEFELDEATSEEVRGRRRRHFPLFDPRRAEHIIIIRRYSGDLGISYRMARTQAYHWLPAHYHTLDREAAALYRYLATGHLDGLLGPVHRQARHAIFSSWGAIAAFWVVVLLLGYLIAR